MLKMPAFQVAITTQYNHLSDWILPRHFYLPTSGWNLSHCLPHCLSHSNHCEINNYKSLFSCHCLCEVIVPLSVWAQLVQTTGQSGQMRPSHLEMAWPRKSELTHQRMFSSPSAGEIFHVKLLLPETPFLISHRVVVSTTCHEKEAIDAWINTQSPLPWLMKSFHCAAILCSNALHLVWMIFLHNANEA